MEDQVDWAAELGLEVRRLWREHPGHPQQLKNKKIMLAKSELYWQKAQLARLWGDDVGKVGFDGEWSLQE